MAASAADPNLQLTHQLLGNPVLQYQLLMHSLILPLLTRTTPAHSPAGGGGASSSPVGGAAAEEEDHLRMAVLANQLAVTQLNQLVMDLMDDTNSKDRGEATYPVGEGEKERNHQEHQAALEYQKKLLHLLKEGFTAVHTEMTGAKDLLNAVLDATLAGQDSMMELQRRVLNTASDGFANTTVDVTRLRDDLHDLTSSHADQLGEFQETVQAAAVQTTRAQSEMLRDSTEALLGKVSTAVSQGFANVSGDVASLRGEVHDLNATYAKHSQEALELTQVTAMGLLRLQADVNNLTATLEEALATFMNITSGVRKEEEEKKEDEKEEEKEASCSDAGEGWRCPDGWFLAGKECFQASTDRLKLGWYQARESCMDLGGDLAAPEDVLSLILAVRKHFGKIVGGMWVGGEKSMEEIFESPRSDTGPAYDLFEDVSWRWISGKDVTHGWLRGRPQGPAGVNTCLTLSDLGLDNAYCEHTLRFLCQHEALHDE